MTATKSGEFAPKHVVHCASEIRLPGPRRELPQGRTALAYNPEGNYGIGNGLPRRQDLRTTAGL